jgi:quercetin dioxygenase-like cupin family protein
MADPGIEAIVGTEPPQRYLTARGLRGSAWSAAPGTWFPEHHHARTKHLFVTRGSIRFNGVEVSAPAGVRIGAGTVHEALAGRAGVQCVEAFEGDPATTHA